MLNEDKNKKIGEFIKGNLLNFIVILTAIAYILYNMLGLKKTDLTIGEVIAKAGIGTIVAIMIKQLLGENGFNKGYASNLWLDQITKHTKACELALPHIEKIDNFYEYEILEKKMKYRRTNLMSVRLRYDTFFDKQGNYTNPSIIIVKSTENKQIEGVITLTKKQYKILNKCIKVKIYNLNLFSEYDNEIENDTHREKTDKDQRARMLGKNGIAAIVTAIIGVYFIPVFTNWSWADFISSLIQVCIWVATGISQLYKNYNYVVIEKVSKLKRKCELLVKFQKGCENGKYNYDPYTQQEIDKQDQMIKEQQKIIQVIPQDNEIVVLDNKEGVEENGNKIQQESVLDKV